MLSFSFRVTMDGFLCMQSLVSSHAECLLIPRNFLQCILSMFILLAPNSSKIHTYTSHVLLRILIVLKPFRTICVTQIFLVCGFCEGWLNKQPRVTTTFRINWVSLSQQLTIPDRAQPGVGFHSQPPLVYMLGFSLALTCTGFYVSLAFNFRYVYLLWNTHGGQDYLGALGNDFLGKEDGMHWQEELKGKYWFFLQQY